MSTTIVPYNPDYRGLPEPHAKFHIEQLRRGRQSLISELRCMSGLPDVVRSLNPDTLYRLVIPNGELLQQGKDGLFRGVFYEGRGIDQHARFAEVRPNLMEAAKTIGSQVLLVSIAMQLNHIEKMIENLSIEMHQDRISEVLAGVDQFEKAMLIKDPTHRNHVIYNAVQTLEIGLHKTISDLRSRIAEAPSPKNKIIDHLAPWSNKLAKATRIMGLALESFYVAMKGIKTLAEAYATLGEREAARKTLGDFFDKINHCNIKSAAEKARLVEPSGPVLPQKPWEDFIEVYPTAKDDLHTLHQTGVGSRDYGVEIEFMSHELQGDVDGNLS
jgi:hypothetical protein